MTRYRLVSAYPKLGFLFRPWIVSNLYEGVVFFVKHRRWPRFDKTGYLNDLLFRIRASESNLVLRAFTADKAFCKIFVHGVVGEDLSVPTIAVLHDKQAIDRFGFPDDCVIKPTHMSSEFIFHRSGPMPEDERTRMRRWMQMNFGDMTGERHYRDLEPKIIVEPWLRLNGEFCHDYRLAMVDGALTSVVLGLRFDEGLKTKQIFLTPDWKPFPGQTLTLENDAGSTPIDLEAFRPKQFSRMLDVAQQIGRYFDFVRVDFYTDGHDQLFVGEISHIIAGVRKQFASLEIERGLVTPQQPDGERSGPAPVL